MLDGPYRLNHIHQYRQTTLSVTLSFSRSLISFSHLNSRLIHGWTKYHFNIPYTQPRQITRVSCTDDDCQILRWLASLTSNVRKKSLIEFQNCERSYSIEGLYFVGSSLMKIQFHLIHCNLESRPGVSNTRPARGSNAARERQKK